MLLVAAAVVALVVILNRFLFGPLNAILAERERETESARAEFEKARELEQERLTQIEARLADARKEAFEIRSEATRDGRATRDEALAAARADAAAEIDRARGEITAHVAAAKRELSSEAETLARQVAERLLGRQVAGTEGKK